MDLQPIQLEQDEHDAKAGFALKRGLKFQSMPCLGCEFKRRYLRVRGKFLFRFDPLGGGAKGVPLDLEVFTVRRVDEAGDDLGEILPFAFELASARKRYLFAVESARTREEWVTALAAARERAIKQRLGHASLADWERDANQAGQRLVDRKERIEANTDLSSDAAARLCLG